MSDARGVSEVGKARAVWDREAARFDDEPDHGLRDPIVRQAWADLLDRLLPAPPARLVDLGCGTGSLSVLLAQRGYGVTAVDVSPKMLAAAQDKARAGGVVVDFQLGNAAEPKLPPRSFDVVLSRHLLWALPDPGNAFQRWVRLLSPQGVVVMVEGCWATGAGITASALRDVVEEHASTISWEPLNDPALWGKEVADERYALVVHPRTRGGDLDR
jgi:ubiquinone/menaquinone biosynthesis C-methylase UbiE